MNPIIRSLTERGLPITVKNVVDDCFYYYVCLTASDEVALDGYYDADQLEALAIAMRREAHGN